MVAALTDRQRMKPPLHFGGRRNASRGGHDVAEPATLAPGIDSDLARYPGTEFDARVLRDRGPWYRAPRYIPPAVTWVNWTAAGPQRAELHQRNATLRTMVGTDNGRYPTVDSPTGGMHTMIPGPGAVRTVQRYVSGTPQMLPGRMNRLSPGQYAGQTFSQTTVVQGGS